MLLHAARHQHERAVQLRIVDGVVALTGIGWTMLDMKRRRMDVTARHSTR